MIQSIQKAVAVLMLLSDSPETPVPLHKMAEMLSLNKTTCHHILETLQESLLVEKVSRTDGYRLGPAAYMLTRYGRYQESLIDVCQPIVKWLNRQLDATVLLTVVCDGIKYIILHIDNEERFDYRNSEIIQGHLETTATGLLMLSGMDKESLQRVDYHRKANESAPAPADRDRKLKQIRHNGYAYVHDEAQQRHSYAFRIHDGRRTVAAIGVLYSDRKDSSEMREKVISKGRAAANEISRRLMFREEPPETANEKET